MYKYRIERYWTEDDFTLQHEDLEETRGLSFLEALRLLENFVEQHPDGHLGRFAGPDSIAYTTVTRPDSRPVFQIDAYIEYDTKKEE